MEEKTKEMNWPVFIIVLLLFAFWFISINKKQTSDFDFRPIFSLLLWGFLLVLFIVAWGGYFWF